MAKNRPSKRSSNKDEPKIEKREPDTNKDNLEIERLKLEIKERKWWWVKVVAPVFTILILGGGYEFEWRTQRVHQSLETERHRKKTTIDLIGEFANPRSAVRIAAARALADYPKEAIPILIACLGTIDPNKREEDIEFIRAAMDSLRKIGEDAIAPLVEELKRKHDNIKEILTTGNARIKKLVFGSQPSLDLYTAFKSPEEYVRKKIESIWPWSMITEEEIKSIISKRDYIRSSRPELLIANKNIVVVLGDLLRTSDIKGLSLEEIDLSGVKEHLASVNLSDANLYSAELSGADLNHANLSGAVLESANLSGANLTFADLSGADLTGVKGFKKVKYFVGTILKDVNGLPEDDLKYAKSKGAIID